MNDFMEEVKNQRVWVHWNWGMKNGIKTKIPCSAAGGPSGTDENWTHTWVTYNKATDTLAKTKADGIGFVIPKGYFFIDVDDYSLDDPFVQKLLNRFNSYTEISVSGGGIHIYGICDFSRIPIMMEDGNLTLDKKRYYMKIPITRWSFT